MAIEDLTPEELEELERALGGSSPPIQERHDIFSFFNKILKTKDTIKVSNLSESELNAFRLLRNLALFAEKMGWDLVAEYLKGEGEVMLASALSKRGFFINAAITQKREQRIGTKPVREVKRGWFRPAQTEEV